MAVWALVILYAAWDILVALLWMPRAPSLLAERAGRPKDAKRWDLICTTLAASVLPLVTWIVAGLDVRFGWTGDAIRYVRHPGYVGAIAFQWAIPFALGSLWALLPSGMAVVLYILRTALEDRTLHEELEGYREYAQHTRYRLVPGIW